MNALDILYQDEHYIAVSKPSGSFVHRSVLEPKADFIMGYVRDIAGCYVWPVHRLDRPTSGVVVFALSKESAGLLNQEFREKKIEKKYIAVVRGYTVEKGCIEYSLREKKNSSLKNAVTRYQRLKTIELKFPAGRYQTARFSLIEAMPETGRFHQIRKHFAHIFHPILCDSVHGDGKQNRFIREKFHINRLLLAATSLSFIHPYHGEITTIKAPVAIEMQKLIDKMFI